MFSSSTAVAASSASHGPPSRSWRALGRSPGSRDDEWLVAARKRAFAPGSGEGAKLLAVYCELLGGPPGLLTDKIAQVFLTSADLMRSLLQHTLSLSHGEMVAKLDPPAAVLVGKLGDGQPPIQDDQLGLPVGHARLQAFHG